MKMTAGILFCILAVASCTRKYGVSSAFRKGTPADMHQIILDSSYRLYVREVFLDQKTPGNLSVKKISDSRSSTDKLIEIEYILLSVQKKNAVYISTIQDKYQDYYYKKIKFLKREYLNAYDFSTFRFGKLENNNSILFEKPAAKQSDTWKYEIEQDSILHIQEVVERKNDDVTGVYLVDESLSRTARFVRVDSFRIAFRNMDKEKKDEKRMGRPPFLRFSKDNSIYYKAENNKYTIYFRFNRNLVGLKDSAISFNDSRLINDPSQLSGQE